MKHAVYAMVVWVALVGGGSSRAGVGAATTFTYQGQLNKNGVPLTASVDMKIALYDGGEVGRIIAGPLIFDGQEGNSPPVEVVKGLFAVTLDFGADAFTGDSRFVQVEIRSPHDPSNEGEYVTLIPRQKITAAPLALQVRGLTVDESGGVQVSGDVRTPGEVAASAYDSSSPNVLKVQGTECARFADGPKNFCHFGVGTSSPQARLHIGGTPGTDGIMFPDGTMQTTAAGPGTLELPFSGSFAGSDQVALSITQAGVGYAADFRSTDAGNYWGAVGVSSNGSGPSLFVTHSGAASCARLQNVVQANNTFPTLHATTFGTAPALLGDATAGTNGTGVIGVGQGTGHGVRGSVGGTGFAGYFTGKGYFADRVGVGVADPQHMLHISGPNNISLVHAENNWITIRGIHTASGSFPGVQGETNSGSSNASGVRGLVNSTAAGSGSAGVWGRNLSTTDNGYGVRGSHSGTGAGVYGESAGTSSGSGVKGYGFLGVSGTANDPDGYGGVFSGSGFLGGGQALLVWGISHLLGPVGIGTTRAIPPGVALAVNGKVLCEEVEVQLSQDWPDHVFAEDYALMPLEELERRIREDRHLPGIPSADQVASEGLAVGAMQAKLLEKVEELTLHVISLNSQVLELRAENKELRERVAQILPTVRERVLTSASGREGGH